MGLLNAGASTFYTNAISSNTDGDYYEMRENGGVTVQVSGTWSGTLNFQQSNDAVTWTTVGALLAPGSGGVQVTSTTTNGLWFMVVQARYFRVAPTAWSSGTANVLVRFVSDGSINYSFSGSSATGANSDQIQGSSASGATDAGNPVKVGGKYNLTLPTLTDGQRGDVQLTSKGGIIATLYSANGTAVGVNAPVDGVAVGTGFYTVSQGVVYNGTTWDRMRKASATSRIVSAAASTNATVAKGSAGDVISITATNTTASLKYLKIYNKATAPTVGTDTPVLTIPLQPSNVPTTISVPGGLYCSAGIGYALTGAAADADTTALVAGDVVGVNVVYA